jgi:hypothetical protein
MPRNSSPGGAWSEQDQASLVREVMSGALSVSDACARHGLSQDCLRDWVLRFRHSAIEAFDEHLRQTLAPQGIAVGEGRAAGFNGSLRDIALADLIQTLTLARRDGVITISQHGSESRIWCADGEIVDAESGRLHGELALYRALALKSGRVLAEFVAVPRARTIFESTSALLLNGARRMDEVHALLARLGDGRYRAASELAEAPLSARDRALLHQFILPSTLRDFLDASDQGDLEALSAVARLIDQGQLCVAAEPSLLPEASRAPGALSTGPMMLSFLHSGAANPSAVSQRRKRMGAGLGGLAALGCIGWLSLGAIQGSASAPSAATPAPASPAPLANIESLAAAPPAADREPVQPVRELAPAPATKTSATSGPGAGVPAIPAAPAASAVPAHQRRAPHPEAAPDTEAAARTAPRMQIIDEQTPRMQIVE